MKKVAQKLTAILLVCVFVLSVTSCGFRSEEEKFDVYLENLFVETMDDDIMSIHFSLKDPESYGIKRPKEINLGEFKLEDLEKEADIHEKQMKHLKLFNRDKLTEKQQQTYDILEVYYETQAMSNGLEYYAEYLSPIGGVHSNLQTNFVEYPFYEKRDVEDYIALLNDLPRFMEQIIVFEKAKSEKGLFMSDDVVEKTITQCEEFVENPEEHCFIEVFDEKLKELPELTEEEAAELREENRKAVLESVIPAYEMLIEELTKLKGTGKNQGGLSNFEQGKAYYEYLVKSKLGSEKTVPELIKAVENELSAQMIALSLIIQSDSSALVNMMTADISMSEPNEIIETLKAKIAENYPEFPKVNYSIKPIYKAVENDNILGYCVIPPIDDQSNNFIRVNESAQSNNLGLFTLLAHEGYPGHMYQNTYWMAQNPYPIRSALSFLGYSEGWATYVERNSYEMAGLSSDTVAQLLQINDALNHLLSCRVDLGVHYEGWDEAKTSEFLATIGIADEAIAHDLYVTVVGDPAVFLPYYVGYMEVSELEAYAEKELGSQFDVKEFRRVYLDTGDAPFKVVRTAVEEYVAGVKAAA